MYSILFSADFATGDLQDLQSPEKIKKIKIKVIFGDEKK